MEKKKNYIIATDKSAAILGNYQQKISNSIIQFSKKNNYHFIDSLDFNFEYSHYYDYNHFNTEGSEFFSEMIYKIILKIINENNQWYFSIFKFLFIFFAKKIATNITIKTWEICLTVVIIIAKSNGNEK